MDKKSNKLYGLIGLVVLCLIGSTFAYWTQEIDVHNEFQTARYDTSVKEEFVSPDNWMPGVEINKDVWVQNDGTIPIFTKVEIHQEWVRKENITDLDGTVILPKEGDKFPLAFTGKEGNEYAAQILWGEDVVLLVSGKKSDIDLGLKTVDQIEDAMGKWLLVSDVPDQNDDFLLYYIGMVDVNGSSPMLVDSVTMNSKIQPAIVQKDTYYDEITNEWITSSRKNSTYDYECSKYTMLITATTVQATEDAVFEVFGTEKDCKEVVEVLSSLAFEPADF